MALKVSLSCSTINAYCGFLQTRIDINNTWNFFKSISAEVDLGRVHDCALERASRDIFAVEFELHHMRFGLLGDEGDGVGVVALGLGTGGHLPIVHSDFQVARASSNERKKC